MAPAPAPDSSLFYRFTVSLIDHLFKIFRRSPRASIMSLFDFLFHIPAHIYRRLFALFAVCILAFAEYQQPGFFPRPYELIVALVTCICGGTIAVGYIAVEEYSESVIWP